VIDIEEKEKYHNQNYPICYLVNDYCNNCGSNCSGTHLVYV